jgi:hypothetical protein
MMCHATVTRAGGFYRLQIHADRIHTPTLFNGRRANGGHAVPGRAKNVKQSTI